MKRLSGAAFFQHLAREFMFCIRAAYGSRLLTDINSSKEGDGHRELVAKHKFSQRTTEAEYNIQILFNGQRELVVKYNSDF